MLFFLVVLNAKNVDTFLYKVLSSCNSFRFSDCHENLVVVVFYYLFFIIVIICLLVDTPETECSNSFTKEGFSQVCFI